MYLTFRECSRPLQRQGGDSSLLNVPILYQTDFTHGNDLTAIGGIAYWNESLTNLEEVFMFNNFMDIVSIVADKGTNPTVAD